jgi:hypothetical protein
VSSPAGHPPPGREDRVEVLSVDAIAQQARTRAALKSSITARLIIVNGAVCRTVLDWRGEQPARDGLVSPPAVSDDSATNRAATVDLTEVPSDQAIDHQCGGQDDVDAVTDRGDDSVPLLGPTGGRVVGQ